MARHPNTPSRALLLAILLSGCTTPPTPEARERAQRSEPPDLAGCTVQEVSREPLTVEDGLRLSIHPQLLEPNGRGDVLLAGRYDAPYRPTGNDEWRRVVPNGDSVLGAVVAADGTARTVAMPFSNRVLGAVRAKGRDDGRWDVLLVEAGPRRGRVWSDSVARLWHGVLDGARWSSLDTVPMPDAGVLRVSSASSLVRHGDTLAWAARLEDQRFDSDVALFERRDGRWVHEVVPAVNALYLDLAHSDTLGLVLAAVQPDRSNGNGGNALFLWTERPRWFGLGSPTWRPLRKVAPGDGKAAHYPSLTLSPEGGMLTWRATPPDSIGWNDQFHALVDPLSGTERAAMVVDTDVPLEGSPAPVPLPGGGRIWLTGRSASDTLANRLRFVGTSGKSTVPLGHVVNGEMRRVAAAATDASTVLVAGRSGRCERGARNTLLVRTRLRCPAATAVASPGPESP